MRRDARRVLFVVIAAMLLLVSGVLSGRSSAPVCLPPAPSFGRPEGLPASLNPIDEMEQCLLDLTNEQRTRVALRPLEREAGLSAVARNHSEDMLRRRFFSHVNPDRQTLADRVARVMGLWTGEIGENLWMWSGSIRPSPRALVEQAVAAWMASPTHRRNILGPGYKRLGVGAAANASDVRLTEVFME